MVTTMGWVAASVLTGFNFVLAALMLSYGAFRTMRGRDVSFGDILRQVGRRAMALLGLGALGTAVAAIVGLVVIGVWGPLAGIPLFVAMLLIFVLAMIAQTMLSVSVLACVVEQLGPMAGMARSFGLTRGYRWQLSGILLAAVVIGLVTGALVVVIVLGLLMGVLEAGRFGEVGGFMMFRFGLSVCGFLWMLLYGAFGGVLVAAIYANLRRAREGDGVDEEVAGVFA
ncbi:MAG: hypothetical protein FWD68_04765 [Alphaproteobacteria bacterium]|nr:hypothetical protein [Alphaproteobacteria bacterium]